MVYGVTQYVSTNPQLMLYSFIALFISNIITSSFFLHYAHEVHVEIIKYGKKSSLVKSTKKKLYNIILTQIIINVFYILIALYSKYKGHYSSYSEPIKGNISSILMFFMPFVYYLIAGLWESNGPWKKEDANMFFKVFTWIVFFMITNSYALFYMEKIRNFSRKIPEVIIPK